jgi:nucleoside-diphosphate-sugar epimerase
MRFATAAGLSTNLRLDLVFNDFIASSVLTKKIELLSSGNSWRPLIHVRDMSRAIKWAIEYKSKKNFLPINIGSDKWNFKIIKLAEKISKIVKGAKIIVKDKKNVDKRSYKVNFNLFKKLAPRHQPNTNFRASVIELKNFLFKEKKNLKNFRNSPKWSRLSMLNYLVKNKKIDKKLLLIKKHDR